ncbi:toprim domain-containing protein [Campylobacter jejuni]|nr:toprim domain-containing protein [Campylobacter jejuni]EDP7298763.1 toprim domain-containing protein [Campylobacter jejuni]
MPKKRMFLFVPYQDIHEAKKLGAMWDNKQKQWFAPKSLDINIFKKWLDNNKSNSYSINIPSAIQSFKQALEEEGLIIDGSPIMDGKIHRVKTTNDKGRELSGAYIGYLNNNFPAGFVQNFKTGIKKNWKMQIEKNQSNNIKSPKELHEQIKKEQELREKEILALQEKTALKLEDEYNNARWANSNHAYLNKKGFDENFYLKQDNKGSLLIPLKDENGKLWSLQRIFPNGDKIIGVIKTQEEKDQGVEYLAKKQGCFHIIGAKTLHNLKEFYICEGFATGATLYKALNKPIIMAVDAGNLENVVKKLSTLYSDRNITIFADNDLKKELKGLENTGKKTALEIKEKYSNVSVILPNFTQEQSSQGMSDFNDLMISKGLEFVTKEIKMQMFREKVVCLKKENSDKELTRG